MSKYEYMRGDNNPMRRPDVAAKQAASLRQTWARCDGKLRAPERAKKLSQKGKSPGSMAALAKGRVWTDERRAAWTAKAATVWTPEMRQAAADRVAARHAARKLLENKHHDD